MRAIGRDTGVIHACRRMCGMTRSSPRAAEHRTRSSRWLLCLLATLAIARGAHAEDFERWYAVRMEGQHAGWMSQSQRTEGDRIVGRSAMSLSVARGATRVSISMEGEFVECTDGRPISMSSTQKLGNVPVEMRGTFRAGAKGTELELSTRQGGSETKATHALAGDGWLAPGAAGEFVKKKLAEGATEIVVRTLDPASGPAIETITRRKIEPTRITVGGKDRAVFQCESIASSAPSIVSTEYLDHDGVPVKFTANLGGIALEFEESTRGDAQREARPPEIMVATFVRPDRVIDRARGRTKAAFVLGVPEGEMPPIASTGSQQFEPIDARHVRARVDAKWHAPAPEEDSRDPAYTRANSMINGDDPAIRELATKALAEAPRDRGARAERLRRFVSSYISRKDLDTALASASEVARSRAGDCTEHAVLLAALLRADGIPARIASGLIYADRFAGAEDVFAYHMWTQALLDVDGKPSWVDLDATLSSSNGVAFDATHIAIMTSALEDGKTTGAMASIVPLLGRLSIKVEHAE